VILLSVHRTANLHCRGALQRLLFFDAAFALNPKHTASRAESSPNQQVAAIHDINLEFMYIVELAAVNRSKAVWFM